MNVLAVCNHDVTVPSKTFGKLMAKCAGCGRRKIWPWAKMVKCCQCKKFWHKKCLSTQTRSSPEVQPGVAIEPQRTLQKDCVKELVLQVPGKMIRNESYHRALDGLRADKITSLRVDHGLREKDSKDNSLSLASEPVRFLSQRDSPHRGQVQTRFFSDSALCVKKQNYYEQKAIPRITRSNNNVRPSDQNRRTIPNSFTPSKMSMDDFTLLRVLGKGNFGKVLFCRHNILNKYFAMKTMKKVDIISSRSVKLLYTEKRIFKLATESHHPFLMNMFGCFQADTHVCFVLEYAAGGDLKNHLKHAGTFEEPRAVFYAACIVSGLQYLHERNIIYRDLKLCNVLMDTRGYAKITDYGTCKVGVGYGDRTGTFCGTPCYMAPEILSGHPYTRSVDWWSLGIVIFEMLVGDYPFMAGNKDELFRAIVYDDVSYPKCLSSKALAIIKGLLNKKPDKRIGSSKRDAKEVKKQRFFKQIVWKDLLERKVQPPYVPTFSSLEDMSYFKKKFTSQRPQLTMPEFSRPLSKEQQDLFKDFAYTSDWFQHEE